AVVCKEFNSRWISSRGEPMTRQEFREFLVTERIRPDLVSIDGENTVPFEQFRIEKKGEGWIVYYFERGQTYDSKWFSCEASAFDYLANHLKDDRTAHIDYRRQ